MLKATCKQIYTEVLCSNLSMNQYATCITNPLREEEEEEEDPLLTYGPYLLT